MKKIFITLATVAVASMVFIGCVQPEVAPAPTPTAPAPTPTAPAPTPEEPSPIMTEWGLPLNPFGEDFAVKPDGTPYVFADSPTILAASFCIVSTGISTSYVERAGGKMTVYDPEFKADVQVSILEDLLVSRPDGIILNTVDYGAVTHICEKIAEEGIPIIALDSELHSDAAIFFVHYDEIERGRMAGEWMVEYAESTGTELYVYELWCPLSLTLSHDRHKGFHDAIEGHPLIAKVMQGPDCCPSAVDTSNAIADAFMANPELNAIFHQGGPVDGAPSGLRQAGLLYPVGDPRHIVIVSEDADNTAVAPLREGYVDVCLTHSPWVQSDVAVKAMFTYVVLGQPVPKYPEQTIKIASQYVNTDTIDDLYFGAPRFSLMDMSDFDSWPVLDIPPELIGGLVTPTKDMRIELLGY